MLIEAFEVLSGSVEFSTGLFGLAFRRCKGFYRICYKDLQGITKVNGDLQRPRRGSMMSLNPKP